MNVLAMFAKHWQAGAVKTRLAQHCGAENAGQIYLAFLRTLLTRFASTGDERWLVYTPTAARLDFEALAASSWHLHEQAAGDLGERMAALFASVFAQGAQRCVLIGSDSPLLPAANVAQAFKLLEHVPVVLGPAADGGYYLIGTRRSVPPIFSGIAWSTDRVLEQTIACLHRWEVAYELLPPYYDIDTVDDLSRLEHELSNLPVKTSAEQSLLDELGAILAADERQEPQRHRNHRVTEDTEKGKSLEAMKDAKTTNEGS